MRFVLAVVLAAALMASVAGATTINVGSLFDVTEIQEGLDLAEAGDTVLVWTGTYDSVSYFDTSVGIRGAIARMPDGVILRGNHARDVVIDHTEAEYAIICENVGADTRIENFTITGGIGRDQGRGDDGDGRNLVAGVACLQEGSPTIDGLQIRGSATGIVIRGLSAPVIEGTVISRGSHHGIYVAKTGGAAVTVDHATIVQNFDHGIYVFEGATDIANSCITHNGKNGVRAYLTEPSVVYCNVYWNDQVDPDPQEGPLDYGGMDDQTGSNGNISLEPFYCDYTGAAGYDYHVCVDSPNVGADSMGGDLGALGGACTECVSIVERSSWGAIKALYR
jgi:hypothetical protein